MNALNSDAEAPITAQIEGIVQTLRKRDAPHLVDTSDYTHESVNTVLSFREQAGDFFIPGMT